MCHNEGKNIARTRMTPKRRSKCFRIRNFRGRTVFGRLPKFAPFSQVGRYCTGTPLNTRSHSSRRGQRRGRRGRAGGARERRASFHTARRIGIGLRRSGRSVRVQVPDEQVRGGWRRGRGRVRDRPAMPEQGDGRGGGGEEVQGERRRSRGAQDHFTRGESAAIAPAGEHRRTQGASRVTITHSR